MRTWICDSDLKVIYVRASGAAPARDDTSEPRPYRDELVVPRVHAPGETGDHGRVDVDLPGDMAQHRLGQQFAATKMPPGIAQAAQLQCIAEPGLRRPGDICRRLHSQLLPLAISAVSCSRLVGMRDQAYSRYLITCPHVDPPARNRTPRAHAL